MGYGWHKSANKRRDHLIEQVAPDTITIVYQ
jgi:hypothetical protein